MSNTKNPLFKDFMLLIVFLTDQAKKKKVRISKKSPQIEGFFAFRATTKISQVSQARSFYCVKYKTLLHNGVKVISARSIGVYCNVLSTVSFHS